MGVNWVRGNIRITIYDQDGTDLDDDVTSGNALDNLGTITIQPLHGPVPADPQVIPGTDKFTQDDAHYRIDYRHRR